MAKNEIAEAIWGTLQSVNESDTNLEAANVVDALCKCARGLHRIADALQRLGNADANTPMGGLEALGAVHKEGYELLANAISEVSSN